MAQLTPAKQRIEPFGWDAEDRTYFLLDDNRLYRRTDPPPPPPVSKPKKNSKKAKASRRASKRRKVSEAADSEAEHVEESAAEDHTNADMEDDGFGGMKWECLAVTLDELNAFVASIDKSRDPNEKILRKRIVDELLPILEKQEEARKRKAAQKERELLNLERLATAKRSSRIAGRLEQRRQEEEAREAERKRQAELAMAKKEQEKWLKLEKERESRMKTREQRLKEREARRILHEEELANLSEDSKRLESGQARLSERQLKAEIERKKQALEELNEEDWIFDCICGAYGQIDDGTHSIACERCNIWQHSKCVGVSREEAERDDFHFICKTCERRAKDAERAKTHPPITIKLNRPGSSSSAMPPTQSGLPAVLDQSGANGSGDLHSSPHTVHDNTTKVPTETAQFTPSVAQKSTPWQVPYVPQEAAVGVSQSNGHQVPQEPSKMAMPSVPAPAPTAMAYDRPSSSASASGKHYSPYANSGTPAHSGVQRPPSAHAFSSPHPHSPTNLPPPVQHESYSFINGNGQGTPVQYNTASYSPATSQRNGQSSPSRAPNGQFPASNDRYHRQGSINLPSPFSGTPVLTPANKGHPAVNLSSSPPMNPRPNEQESALSPGTQLSQFQQVGDPSYSSPLPPVATGLSPTKHSPPRPTTSNGNLASATPSVLPPVASLSPSPQLQNLTPPVKPSEPERSRENGHGASF